MRVEKMFREMEQKLFSKERLRELGLFNLEMRSCRGDLVVALSVLNKKVCSNRTRGNDFETKEGRFR